MANDNKPQKRISDIIRKLLKSAEVSTKQAALYLDCTEQSFRNKLSRDSFSLRDLIILCYLCNASLRLEYDSLNAEDEFEFLIHLNIFQKMTIIVFKNPRTKFQTKFYKHDDSII